jgi:hypothetical protein
VKLLVWKFLFSSSSSSSSTLSGAAFGSFSLSLVGLGGRLSPLSTSAEDSAQASYYAEEGITCRTALVQKNYSTDLTIGVSSEKVL